VEEEYERAVERVEARYGTFRVPDVYIPTLDQTDWRDYFLPDGKFYGRIFFLDERSCIVINTWLFLRLLEEFGEGHVGDKLFRFFVHELVHHVRRELPDLEVNIIEERLVRGT